MTDGIVNVLKPPGMTSHDVVSRIRRIYGIRKAGHSGTLDPDAAGVLPVFIGNATRLLEYAATATKRYRAEGMFGIRTDTGDDSGNILETKPVPAISATEFENVLQQFRGKILQVPPMYSALKVNGKKLYEYAREGIIIERPARPVEIFRLDCVKLYPPYLILLPLEAAVRKTERLYVNELQAFRITSGVRTTVKGTAAGTYSLYLADAFLGMVSVEDEIVKPEKILVQVKQPPEPV